MPIDGKSVSLLQYYVVSTLSYITYIVSTWGRLVSNGIIREETRGSNLIFGR